MVVPSEVDSIALDSADPLVVDRIDAGSLPKAGIASSSEAVSRRRCGLRPMSRTFDESILRLERFDPSERSHIPGTFRLQSPPNINNGTPAVFRQPRPKTVAFGEVYPWIFSMTGSASLTILNEGTHGRLPERRLCRRQLMATLNHNETIKQRQTASPREWMASIASIETLKRRNPSGKSSSISTSTCSLCSRSVKSTTMVFCVPSV